MKMDSKTRAVIAAASILVLLFLAGCGWITPDRPDAGLQADAAEFARLLGISQEEALMRLQLQEEIGELNARLEQEEAQTFAGLWIQHEPVYRVVAAFTHDGEQTLRPYLAGKAWAGLVEVRHLRYSLQELLKAQAQVHEAATRLEIPISSGLDLMENRVVVQVADTGMFLEELGAAGFSLPEGVEVVSNSQGDPPLTLRAETVFYEEPDGRIVYFPKQAPVNVYMQALLEGTLVLDANGCLRVDGGPGFMPLVLWHYDFEARILEDSVEVLNGAGQVVARTGEPVRMGGGAAVFPGLPSLACPGPYWVLGEIQPLEH